jgi:toxin ParE1/3/4
VTKADRTWRVRLSSAAESDIASIAVWTARQFGEAQALAYVETIGLALEALAGGPEIVGARTRDDIAKGLRDLHVSRGGRRGRHLILFRISRRETGEFIDVLRILHDAMDLKRHIR